MRIFQFHSYYRQYLNYFNEKFPEADTITYKQRLELLLNNRFMAVHVLEPDIRCIPSFQYTVANDSILQNRWAEENGLKSRDFREILRAQIEEHRTEVLYSLDPITFDSQFIRSLPGCVRKTICWLAAPQFRADLSAYNLRICNFPFLLEKWKKEGHHSAWFSPSWDPAMQIFSENTCRPIDVSFVGQFSWLHKNRNKLLEIVAQLSHKYFISFRLMAPKWTRLANIRLLNRVLLPVPYLPKVLREVSGPPVFGRELYELFGQSKIVFNAAIDMSEKHRGNMRCFEALGCGAGMVSDEGIYPEGLYPGLHFETFKGAAQAIEKIEMLLTSPEHRCEMARRGADSLKATFSKTSQWERFKLICE